MNRCSHCGSTENLHIYTTRTLKDGSRKHYYHCNNCDTSRARNYRATAQGSRITRAAADRYDLRNPKRRPAWTLAQHAIPLKPCIKCGRKDSHRHHPDINQPLKVVMLCPLHHKEAHAVA